MRLHGDCYTLVLDSVCWAAVPALLDIFNARPDKGVIQSA